MGQKVNPHGLRVGVIKNWDSRWFTSDKKFGDTLVSDYNIRKYLKKELQAAGVPKIEIERDSQRVRVFNLYAAATDNHTGLCTVDENSYSVAVTFDLYLRNACALEFFLQIFSDFVIGYESIAKLFIVCEPSRVPILNYAHTKTVGINFLTHFSS